jgi:hypothetical protein
MCTWLASLVGGPVNNGLINALQGHAANTQDRVAADLAVKEIEAEIEARKVASAIMIAEQGCRPVHRFDNSFEYLKPSNTCRF